MLVHARWGLIAQDVVLLFSVCLFTTSVTSDCDEVYRASYSSRNDIRMLPLIFRLLPQSIKHRLNTYHITTALSRFKHPLPCIGYSPPSSSLCLSNKLRGCAGVPGKSAENLGTYSEINVGRRRILQKRAQSEVNCT